MSSNDPYLHELYWSLNDSPMQRKLRRLCPLPIGVVYIQQHHHGEAEMRAHFRQMRGLGFNNLKQFQLMGEQQIHLAEAEQIALDERIIPWHYGLGGWQDITPELLAQLNIEPALSMQEIQEHPHMIEYQTQVLRQRSRRNANKPKPPPIAGGMGEPSRMTSKIPPDQVASFVTWLQERYGTIEACLKMYKMYRANARDYTWEKIAEPFIGEPDKGPSPSQPIMGWTDFRRVRDVMRFQADRHFQGISATAQWSLQWDTEEPLRAGCHMIFENQAISGWDFELQASAIRESGSFYASFHPAHHLNEVEGELEIPAYLTARLVHDFYKGGWSAMWESVGGPTSYSGSHSFYFDGNTLTKCLLSYLAAGLKGVGIWCWNVRDYGYELGEYALTDLTGKPTSRAVAAGQVAQACQKYRFELWEANDQPRVGILYSWENDAAFARMSMGGYAVERLKDYPSRPSQARIGVARALINHNVPFEFVTERDLDRGLAGRYKTIYIPHTICLAEQTVSILREYVERGGHVIIDSPTLLLNTEGLLYNTAAGSDYEQLFGIEHADMQDTFNHPITLQDMSISGQTFDVNITSANVLATFDNSDRPAILENYSGQGKATVLTFAASMLCHKPGNTQIEQLIVEHCLSGEAAPWTTDVPVLTYRRVAPQADHYFFINDKPEEYNLTLLVTDQRYDWGEDCITGEKIAVTGHAANITVPANGGKWIRLVKNPQR